MLSSNQLFKPTFRTNLKGKESSIKFYQISEQDSKPDSAMLTTEQALLRK